MNNMNNLSSNNHPIIPNQSLISQTSTPKASQITVGVYSEGSAKVEKHLGETQLFQKMRMENSNYLGFKSLEREVIELKHSFSQFEESIQTLEDDIKSLRTNITIQESGIFSFLKTSKIKKLKEILKSKVEEKTTLTTLLARTQLDLHIKEFQYKEFEKQFNEEPLLEDNAVSDQQINTQKKLKPERSSAPNSSAFEAIKKESNAAFQMQQVASEMKALELEIDRVLVEIDKLNTEINDLENKIQSGSNKIDEKNEIKKVGSIWLSFMKILGFNKSYIKPKNDETNSETIDNYMEKLKNRMVNLNQHEQLILKWVEKEKELNKQNPTQWDEQKASLHLEVESDLDLVSDSGEMEMDLDDIDSEVSTSDVETDRESVNSSNRPLSLADQIKAGKQLKKVREEDEKSSQIHNSTSPPSVKHQIVANRAKIAGTEEEDTDTDGEDDFDSDFGPASPSVVKKAPQGAEKKPTQHSPVVGINLLDAMEKNSNISAKFLKRTPQSEVNTTNTDNAVEDDEWK